MMFKALRVETDGTHTDLTLDGRELTTGLRKELGGEIEFAHYGRRLDSGSVRGICAVVGEYSQFEEPRNPGATAALVAVRAAELPSWYSLYGPVIFLGWDGSENDLSLPDVVQAEVLAALKPAGSTQPARCGRALSTGQPCPEHDAFVFSTLIAHHKDPATASRALAIHRAEVLREAADAVWPHYGAAAVRLRRMANEAGKDTPTGATSTQVDAELVVYRAGFAGHDIPLGLYQTAAEARKHCEAYARREQPGAGLRWYPDTTEGDNEEAPEGLFALDFVGDESDTGYVVTPLTVASAYDEETDE